MTACIASLWSREQWWTAKHSPRGRTRQIFIGVTPPPFLYHNLPKGDGSVADPYLIYDAYLLQAIGGTVQFPPEALTTMASLSALSIDETRQAVADLFGDDATRATASYLLANDIDASIARGWDLEAGEARGFSPIGTETAPFRGRFDGDGNRINDLFIRRPDANSAVGLFAQADAAFFANLEIANARVSGGGDTGALVGAVAGAATVTSVWAQGRVESTNEEADRGIGGLIGRYAGELTVARSWFAGEALGGTNVGGLIRLGRGRRNGECSGKLDGGARFRHGDGCGRLARQRQRRQFAAQLGGRPGGGVERGRRLGRRWRGCGSSGLLGCGRFRANRFRRRSQRRFAHDYGHANRRRLDFRDGLRFSDFERHQCDGAKRRHRRGLDAHQRCRIGFAHRLSGF